MSVLNNVRVLWHLRRISRMDFKALDALVEKDPEKVLEILADAVSTAGKVVTLLQTDADTRGVIVKLLSKKLA